MEKEGKKIPIAPKKRQAPVDGSDTESSISDAEDSGGPDHEYE